MKTTYSKTAIFLMLGLALTLIVPNAFAAPVRVANLATVVGAPVDIYINGAQRIVGLNYLGLERLALNPGQYDVTVMRAGTSDVLAQTAGVVRDVPTSLYFYRNGTGANFKVLLAGDPVIPEVPGFPSTTDGQTVVFWNFAAPRIDIRTSCTTAGSNLASGGGAVLGLGRFSINESSNRDCVYSGVVNNAEQSTSILPIRYNNPATSESIMFAVGDGTPGNVYRLVHLIGNSFFTSNTALPDPNESLKSVNYWRDTGRPGQGLTLFEVSRGAAVHGLTNSFDSNGQPDWLYMDGTVLDGSGRRELRLWRVVKKDGKSERKVVGQGTLTYLSCNEAEVVMQFADNTRRAQRLERTSKVATCSAVL